MAMGERYVGCVCGGERRRSYHEPSTRHHRIERRTVFEWYDFYLYGSLAAIIAKQFFSALNPASGFIFALLAFAAGLAVRPFGAII